MGESVGQMMTRSKAQRVKTLCEMYIHTYTGETPTDDFGFVLKCCCTISAPGRSRGATMNGCGAWKP